jgi:hypothetical protein
VNRERHFPLHGRGLGAATGAAVGLGAALVVHQIVPHHNGTFALPATIVTALFVGIMAGLMFSSIIVGGREDDRATQTARQALAGQEGRSRPADPEVSRLRTTGSKDGEPSRDS